MNTGKRVSVVIPAYNEQNYIEKTISAISNWGINAEIIVVDDGSKDKTGKIMQDFMQKGIIKAIFLENNLGKGQALMQGIKYANGDLIMFLDADLGESAEFAVQLIEPLVNDDLDMTIAVLPKAIKKGGLGLVKGLAGKGIYYFTGFKSEAPLSGQRAFKRRIINEISSFTDGFGIEVGFTIDVLKKGFLIREVKIPLKHRETGRDIKGFLHRGKEFLAVLKALIYIAGKYRI